MKQFKRSSAGQNLMNPNEIRPSDVLRKTVDYLLIDLLKDLPALLQESHSLLKFGIYYDFAFDRLRAVRQDIVVQRLANDTCFYILEKCIEFYAYSEYIWQHFQANKATSEIRQLAPYFDAHLNRVHLTECLNLLLRYYDQFEDTVWSRSRPLYEAAFLIYNLETNQTAVKRYQFLKQSAWSRVLFDNPVMQVAGRILVCHLLGNHIKCLRLVIAQFQSHPLFCVIFYISNLSNIHLQLIKQTCTVFRSANTAIPLPTLADWFCPSHYNLLLCVDYLEQLSKYFQIPVESSLEDHFNFNTDDGDSSKAPKKMLIKQKFDIDQWKAPTDLHPIGWFPKLNNLYQIFER